MALAPVDFKIVILSGWMSRIISILLIIINTRLLVQVVDIEGVAAHAIIASFATWLTLLNLGIPFAAQNMISRWRARSYPVDKMRDTASSVILLLSILFLPFVLIAAYATHRYLAHDYPFLSLWALISAFFCLFIGGMGLVYTSILHAEHKSFWPNMYPGFTSLSVFFILLLFRYYKIDDLNTLLQVYFLPNVFFVLLAFRLLGLKCKFAFDRLSVTALLDSAKGFAATAALGALTLGADFIILVRLSAPEDVAAYSLTSKMFLAAQAIYAVVLNSAWTPIGDLYFSGQLRGARSRAFQLGAVGLILAGVWSTFVAIGAPYFLKFLSPDSEVYVSSTFLGLWIVYTMIRIWSDSFYVVLQSFGDTAALMRYMVFQAPISIGFQIVLGIGFGVNGILLGIGLSFVLTCMWYLPYRTYILTRNTEKKS